MNISATKFCNKTDQNHTTGPMKNTVSYSLLLSVLFAAFQIENLIVRNL